MSLGPDHPLVAELREIVQRIGLISHIGGTSYDGKVARDTSESIGGRRPSGGDHEPRPRRPKGPRLVGDLKSEKTWDKYEEDLTAWRACYQRRTPDYFRRRLERCQDETQLRALIKEARETLGAWRFTPIPKGQSPEFGSPQWKRYVAESKEDAGVLATRYFCTRRYINAVRKVMRDGGLMPLEDKRRGA